jgi:hypothetical protein
VHWFNPFAEGAIALGRAFTPNRHQAGLARDLAHLPMFLAREDDVVLVPARPPEHLQREVKAAGWPLPEWIDLGADPAGALASLAGRKLGALRPWAWAPDSLELFEPLLGSVTGEPRTREQRYHSGLGALYSKAWGAGFLGRFLATVDSADHSWLCEADDVGVTVESLSGALEAIRVIRARGHHRVVVKEALGLAGSNALRLWEPSILPAQERWMAGALNAGPLVVEPWLERVYDWSIQLEMEPRGLRLCGFTGLLADASGRYLGNVAAPNHARHVPAAVASWLAQPVDIAARVRDLVAELVRQLERELRSVDYAGPVGIDALVCRDAAGRCRLKPVVEVNPRCTMGRVLIELMRRACPGRHGRLRLLAPGQVRATGFADFAAWAAEARQRHPIRLEGEPVPRLQEGLVCLNDPATARSCLAVFEVSPQAWPPSAVAPARAGSSDAIGQASA